MQLKLGLLKKETWQMDVEELHCPSDCNVTDFGWFDPAAGVLEPWGVRNFSRLCRDKGAA
jgi:hypothetical protein